MEKERAQNVTKEEEREEEKNAPLFTSPPRITSKREEMIMRPDGEHRLSSNSMVEKKPQAMSPTPQHARTQPTGI